MKSTTALITSSLLALATAAPTPTQDKRSATSDCSQYGQTSVGDYIVYNDLWGQDNGSGSQCVTVTGLSDSSLQWSTTWSWANNPNDVKSYSNVVYDTDAVQLSGISSMKSSWDWKYAGDDVDADVAYDLFTSSSADGDEEFEVMIWLAALGSAGPISADYSASGNPQSIASPTVAGYSWKLYKGSNGVQTVYSFLPSDNIESFSGDVNEFFAYLIKSQGFDGSQYLVSIGAGTEAFTGQNAEFTVSGYSMSMETGSSSGTAKVAVSSSATAATSSMASTSSVAASSTVPTTSAVSSSSAAAYTSSVPVSSYATPSSTPSVSSTTAPYQTNAAQPSGIAQTSAVAQSSGAGLPSGTATSAAALPSTSALDSDCEVEYVYV